MGRRASLRIRTRDAVALATLGAALVALPARAAPPGGHAGLARGRLLVASRALADPSFHESVILLLEYGPTGALGVIVNRPTDVPLETVLPDVAELHGRAERVFLGGPVARDRMILLVRSAKPLAQSAAVLEDLFITPSMDVLRELAREKRDDGRFRAFVGYAGWGPGQLDHELERGDWHTTPGQTAKVLTHEPAKLWAELHERAQGEWVRATPQLAPARLASLGETAPGGAQRSIGGVALPPFERNACRASTLAFTS